MLKMSLTIHLQASLYQIHLQDKFFCPSTKPPYEKCIHNFTVSTLTLSTDY